MKRGFRQFLHPPRLDDIRKTWLTHSVPSFVARKMEALLCVSSSQTPLFISLPSPFVLSFVNVEKVEMLTGSTLCSPDPDLRSDGGGWMSF